MDALESLLVGLIVFLCAVFSVWRLMSVRIRMRVLDALSRLPPGAGGGLATVLRRRTLARLSAGCGACAGNTLNARARPLNQKPVAPRR